MSEKERKDRKKHAEDINKRRAMVKGVEDFYNNVPEERRNPDHKEDFDSLLQLFVDDRSEMGDKRTIWITAENLELIGFTKENHKLGYMYVRGDIRIMPSAIMEARKHELGEYKIEEYRLTLRDIEIEIRRKLKPNS